MAAKKKLVAEENVQAHVAEENLRVAEGVTRGGRCCTWRRRTSKRKPTWRRRPSTWRKMLYVAEGSARDVCSSDEKKN